MKNALFPQTDKSVFLYLGKAFLEFSCFKFCVKLPCSTKDKSNTRFALKYLFPTNVVRCFLYFRKLSQSFYVL